MVLVLLQVCLRNAIQLQRVLKLSSRSLKQRLYGLHLGFQLFQNHLPPLVLIPSQLQHVNFIWAVHESHCPSSGIHVRERGILRDSGPSIGLDRAINHTEKRLGY